MRELALQRGFAAFALVLVAIATAFAAFDRGDRGDRGTDMPDVTGEWKSWRSAFLVTPQRSGYRIEVVNRDGFLGGVYTGKVHRDVILVTGPMSALCKEIRYAKEDDALEFCGEAFQRVPHTQVESGASPQS